MKINIWVHRYSESIICERWIDGVMHGVMEWKRLVSEESEGEAFMIENKHMGPRDRYNGLWE